MSPHPIGKKKKKKCRIFSEHFFALMRLIFYLNTLQRHKQVFLYLHIDKNKKKKNGKFIDMITFAESCTSSSIPGEDLEI